MQKTKGKSSFNSTTVQLIPCFLALLLLISLFQFHNGTINTQFVPRSSGRQNLFQFHNGTINTQVAQMKAAGLNRFNSTTVQLIL